MNTAVECIPRVFLRPAAAGISAGGGSRKERLLRRLMPGIVPIISNGSDARGSLIEDRSPGFRRAVEEGALFIGKGQGNCDSIRDSSAHVFIPMRVERPVVAERVDIPAGSMVICERGAATEQRRNCIRQ